MKYLIWSFEHKAWWRSNQAGYTEEFDQAGRYSALEAGEIVTNSVMGEEVAIEEHIARLNGEPTVSGLWEKRICP